MQLTEALIWQNNTIKTRNAFKQQKTELNYEHNIILKNDKEKKQKDKRYKMSKIVQS